MSIESHEPQFKVKQPPRAENAEAEVARTEQDLNEIIPVLAHGLVRRIEQKGFSGKVRVRATVGNQWGVAKSPDNPTDVPNVIIYPRESLSGDKRLTNARLRHEIGNLNYPIDAELNGLRDWCETHDIAPELLTSLVEATHEASVNYLEMQNSHSDRPEENFRALYEHDINTQQIADGISQSAPYKQAVDIVLLYSLSQTGLIPKEQFEQAIASADPSVQEIFDKQTRSVLDQAVKMAVPKKQVQLVRDYLWPKFSKLIAPPVPGKKERVETHDVKTQERKASKETAKGDKGKETSAKQVQMKEIQERLQKMMEKMREQSRQQKQARQNQQQKPRQEQKEGKQERKTPQQKELSAAEKQERAEEENLLAQNLQEQLQQAKEQLEQIQKPGEKPEAPKPQEKPKSMQDIGKQAEQMKQQAEQAMQDAKEAADEITEEQLQKLKEQLEQIEEVAKQIAESSALEEELAKPEEEPMTYNIKEYGINETMLTPEQLENLQKTRAFAQNTSRVYRTAMRLLMKGYQQHNPKFNDKLMQKMMERGYDLPDFSLYGSQAAEEFLSQQQLGIDEFSDNFLVNFQLPKPLAKFWYKGGNGSKSIPVKEGEIEWGHFYRMCMPVIYSSVDRAQVSGLYLNRLNQFGQHDPKKYYYLWETIDLAQERQKQEDEALKEMQEQLQQLKEKLDEMCNQTAGKPEREKSEQSGQKSEKAESQQQPGKESSEKSDSQQSKSSEQSGQSEKNESGRQKSNEQKQAGQEQQSSEQGDKKPSAQELQKQIEEMKDRVDQMIQDAEDRDDQAMADELKEIKEQLEQMAEKLEKGEQGDEQGEGQESGEQGQQGEGQEQGSEGGQPGEGQGEGEGQESQGEGFGSGFPGQGQGQGQGSGEGGQGESQGGGQPGKGMGQSKGTGQPEGGQAGQGAGEPEGFESGSGGIPSAQEMQELMSQMQDMLNQAKGQGGAPGSQEAIQQMLDKLADMQESLKSGASPQQLADQMSQAMQEMSDMMSGEEGMEGGELGQESSGEGSDQSGGESGEQSHEQFQHGGTMHKGAVEGMFRKPNEELLRQLRQAEAMVGSKFSTKDESGNFAAKDISGTVAESLKSQMSQTEQVHARQLETLEELKRQQEVKMEAMYREMSGLDGEALRVYMDYMESTKEFINDLTEFFVDKFKLDKEYLYERNQRRGAKLQRGFTQNILGEKRGQMVIDPRSFERKRPPEKPQFAWTLIIDNSGSCFGEIIEQEKKLAVALIEVAKGLDIPLEIITFGGPDQFIFLKTFEQNIAGEDLQKVVLLKADQGTPDVITLDAACTSMEKFADKFKRSYNFVYFMTDGQSGEGSIQEVIKKYKKDMVITGIGMAEAAQTIAQTWGKNAVEVPDVKKLSDAFIRKVEDQIDQIFD